VILVFRKNVSIRKFFVENLYNYSLLSILWGLVLAAKKVVLFSLYGIGLAMATASIVLPWFGLPPNYDTEQLFMVGLFVVAIASIASIRKKRRFT